MCILLKMHLLQRRQANQHITQHKSNDTFCACKLKSVLLAGKKNFLFVHVVRIHQIQTHASLGYLPFIKYISNHVFRMPVAFQCKTLMLHLSMFVEWFLWCLKSVSEIVCDEVHCTCFCCLFIYLLMVNKLCTVRLRFEIFSTFFTIFNKCVFEF